MGDQSEGGEYLARRRYGKVGAKPTFGEKTKDFSFRTPSFERCNRASSRWLKAKEVQWQAQGRINRYGMLIVGIEPMDPWTPERVRRAFEHLTKRESQRIARLLNGK